MPELPEVETTCRGIKPFLLEQTISKVIIRRPTLRWPIPADLPELLKRRKVLSVERRAKYLIIQFTHGYLLMHLGMSGKLQVLPHFVEPGKHDHFDLVLTNKKVLRFNDPRRFGAILWGEGNPEQHKLLCDLGPEPLEKSFIAEYLYKKSRKRSMPIKTFIMNSKVVVGVGNIYANEALFISGIRPTAEAGSISFERMEKLVAAIKKVLRAAIKQGGTTLKDFYGVNGQQGYFALKLKVYGRGGEACVNCLASLQEIRLGGRATVFCGSCQKD